MKKLLYTLAGVSFLFSSCADDYLDTMPESQAATGIMIESTSNAKLAVNGLCRLMGNQYIGTQGYNGEGTIKIFYGNYAGNDYQKCNLTGWTNTINSKYHESNTTNQDVFPWFYYYKLISNANAIIVNIDNATGPESEKQYIKAQALTFRAYSYFMLSQLYSYRWVDSNNGASRGLPLRLEPSIDELAASTLGEVYAQVYQDLNDAIENFQASGLKREANDNYSPNLDVAYAVFARAALTRQDWDNAAKYAALARQGYSLMSVDEYVEGGFNTPNSEWIWSLYSAEDQQLYYYSFFAYQASNSNAGQCKNYPAAISKELYNLIPESDVRRGMFLAPTPEEEGSYNTKTGAITNGKSSLYKRGWETYGHKLNEASKLFAYMQFKFQNTANAGIGHVNHFRASEMYLIEAEAKCHLGGKDSEVQQLLTELTQGSGRDPEYTCTKTGADLLEEVCLYRRIELWGEGFDWFDHKRWNKTIVRKAHPEGSFHSSFAITMTPEMENKWTWVYPARECDYNSLLNGQYKE